VARKKKHLPEFNPLAGEGESTTSVLSDVHVPIAAEDQPGAEGMIVAEYRLDHILPDYFQSRGGVLPRSISVDLLKGEINPQEALAAWKEITEKEEAQERQLLYSFRNSRIQLGQTGSSMPFILRKPKISKVI